MSTHDKIDLPPPAGHYYEWDGVYGKRKFTTAPHNGRECDRAVAYYTEDQVRAAIEADRKRMQSEAEEVCGEAYQVVGSLLSDLGIFETDHAKKILDNLSQAKMVHKDVLPWPSFDRKRRDETVLYASQEALDLISQSDAVVSVGLTRVPQMSWNVPLYTAPQPAESCASLIRDKTACGSENGNCDSQPAEPEQCFCDRMYPDSNPDASCGDCPTRDYGVKPAEPVKSTCKKCNGTGVESTRFHGVWPNGEECLEPIKCDQCDGFGTTSAAEPVKVPSDADILDLWTGDPTHSRPVMGKNKVIAFARALLDRYGKGTP